MGNGIIESRQYWESWESGSQSLPGMLVTDRTRESVSVWFRSISDAMAFQADIAATFADSGLIFSRKDNATLGGEKPYPDYSSQSRGSKVTITMEEGTPLPQELTRFISGKLAS